MTNIMRLFPKTAYGNIAAAFAAFLCSLFCAKESIAVCESVFDLYAAANVIMAIVRFFRWLSAPEPSITISCTIETGEE